MDLNERVRQGMELCKLDECKECPYKESETCMNGLLIDAESVIERLNEENRAMRTELAINKVGEPFIPGGRYWRNICDLNMRQEQKGKETYGVTLEENTTLTRRQRIEHLQEELLDGLKYCEHLKELDEDGITANDYQRAALRTAGDDRSKYLLNGVLGLCGEAGEVIDIVKKYLFQGHDLDRDKVVEELGDVLWYCALIAEAVRFPLGLVMELNISKLIKRYPEGFSKERSINREGE